MLDEYTVRAERRGDGSDVTGVEVAESGPAR
jgi:hypothetical protein